jgi:hypothetical protein
VAIAEKSFVNCDGLIETVFVLFVVLVPLLDGFDELHATSPTTAHTAMLA